MTSPSNSQFPPSVDDSLDKSQLSTLVDMDSPEAVYGEVVHILRLINPDFDISLLDCTFKFTKKLYEGKHPNYKACNTPYHNFRHVTDTFLAMVRLLHGAQLSGEKFTERQMVLGGISALMHDTGMLQESQDSEGTGAKYTQDHVKLSMNFIEQQADQLHLADQEVADIRDMILCTDLMAEIPAINFSDPAIELLGKMLGTADLIAQMADRTYLEKLLFLFHEFREAQMVDSENEVEFLRQTLNFYEISENRFDKVLDNTSRYMVPHFQQRWDIQTNLYIESLNKQHNYLKKILRDEGKSIYEELKRGKIVKKVRKEYGKLGQPDTTEK
jgi:hypothetical protein